MRLRQLQLFFQLSFMKYVQFNPKNADILEIKVQIFFFFILTFDFLRWFFFSWILHPDSHTPGPRASQSTPGWKQIFN